MEKHIVGKFMVLLQEDGALKIVALDNKECVFIKPITANSIIIISK